MRNESVSFDIVVAGGGPVGLAFAASLSRRLAAAGLTVAVVDPQPEALLRAPAFDGREVALTQRSQTILRDLGAWARIPDDDVHPLREAQVRNGTGGGALRFAPDDDRAEALARLVPNYRIREALFGIAVESPGVSLLTGRSVERIADGPDAVALELNDGLRLRCGLLVAADSRFSRIRAMRGIGASVRRFGKTMMVCRVEHERAHDGTAVEWFGYGQTMAMLPLRGRMSSAVLTLAPLEIEALMAMDESACSAALTERCAGRLGPMRLASTRHAYPLVGVYADRFVARRFALLGDAAVGMHPVTAHGFNFGLHGQATLADAIAAASARGGDTADATALLSYERQHRRATLPLYMATNATAMLYTNDSPPARLLRDAALFCGNLPPVRRTIVRHLMQRAADQTASAAR